jgi:H+-transporting ATPase
MATRTDRQNAVDAKPVAKDDLQKLPMAEVERRLGSSPDGLNEEEAKKRLAQYGLNKIVEKKTNALLKFLSYFWGPIPWMIEVAVVLSGVVRHWPDFFIILVLLFANGIIGFWEERQLDMSYPKTSAKREIELQAFRKSLTK